MRIVLDAMGTDDAPRIEIAGAVEALRQHESDLELILVGDREILLDDSRKVGENAKAAGVEIEVDIWPGMFHDWWLFGAAVPESKQCLRKVAEWI